jgi:hypothetical protein
VGRGDESEELEEAGPIEPRRGAGYLGVLLAVSAIPILLLAVSAMTGLGLGRNLPTFPAVAGGLAIVLLPVFGLASLIGTGARAGELGGCGWFWSLALLLAMPFYFPGERAQAARSGLDYLTTPVAEAVRAPVLGFGAILIDLLGAEPEATPLAGALPGPAAEAARAAEDARQVREIREARGDVVVPYEGQGETMRVAAFFDGPRYGEELQMVFDTGATYTTLNREALELLEVSVPRDAPVAILRTANGEIEAPLVLIDAVWLGDAVVEWVTVAVCEPCANEGVYGLLGLNVSGQFKVSLDHDHHLIQLSPLEAEENRKLDISQWLRLRSRLLRWRDGRLEVEVIGSNRANVPIGSFSASIDCPGGSFEVVVDGVPPLDVATRKVALPRGTDCSEYSVTLRQATWIRNRF